MHTLGIVNYNSHTKIKDLMNSLSTYKNIDVYIFDNNSSENSKNYLANLSKNYSQIKKVFYNNVNLGFGRAHNAIMDFIEDLSDYHHIVNPDIEIVTPNFFYKVENSLKDNYLFGVPRIIDASGNETYNSKMFPTLLSLIASRVLKNPIHSKYYRKINGFYIDVNKKHEVSLSSGSYIILSKSALKAKFRFDSRFFMYFEDVDFFRNLAFKGIKCQYDPELIVKHAVNRESKRNLKLFIIHIYSLIKYSFKWGLKLY